MEVVQVLNHFLPQQVAGTEVYAWALSKRLQRVGVNVQILIPGYGEKLTSEYTYDDLRVVRYGEPSVVDRPLIMGFREPDGLPEFVRHIAGTQPDIIHFHELAGSNGIGLHHVLAAKRSGSKVVMTFHLASNSCKTGTLFFRGNEPCDGVIDVARCSTCYLHGKTSPIVGNLLHGLSHSLYELGVDTRTWRNRAGTALGTSYIIDDLKKRFKILVQHCDKIIVLAKWYERILVANGVPAEKIAYVPQALPSEGVLAPARVADKATGGPLRLVFLGRIDPLKGLHLLLEALHGIPEDKIELDIFGQPRDAAYETEWREKTSVRRNIRWKGRIRHEDVIDTMAQYDALCLCSTFSEMSPLVIQEAFAAHIPVIASDVYGNAEQVAHDRNGLLFRFNDTAALRMELLRCIARPDLLKELKDNIKPPRAFDEVTEDYLRIYQELVQRAL